MNIEIITDGLATPEGPLPCADGSVLVVEVAASRITRVLPDGRKETVAETGGGPNGIAVGPDGLLYCCNNGGFDWDKVDLEGGHAAPAPDYTGGTVQRVDPKTGKVELLLSGHEGRNFGGPNDIVFAADGTFWFTDFGKWTSDATRHGGLYHASIDGKMLRQVAYGTCLNGVGLSPDGRTVYAAATSERWLLRYSTDPAAGRQHGEVVANFPGRQFLDSFAMEASGTIAVGCLFENPGIGRVDPASGATSVTPMPDRMPTNIAFGGADMRDAYITFTERGALAKCRWPVAGMRLPFNL
jgi:gluconolactonase